MKRYSLKIAYVGTDYHGYQKQPRKKTIEGNLLDALTKINIKTKDPNTRFQTAGRTDRGVHAFGQTIAFTTKQPVIIPKLNKALPADVRCWAKTEVDIKFNPRYAISRSYVYAAPYRGENLKRIEDAAMLLIGEHDFRYFSSSAPGRTTVREMLGVKVERIGNLIFFTFKARSFLWKMVRKIVSALLSVGQEKMSRSVFNSILIGSSPAKGSSRMRSSGECNIVVINCNF